MNLNQAPQHALVKLIALEEQVEHLTQQFSHTTDAIPAARERLTGSFQDDQGYQDLRATLDQLLADKTILQAKLHAANSLLSSCKSWLALLTHDAVLEAVSPETSGHDLTSTRDRINAAQSELAALRAIPTPSADIELHIRDYVRSLGRPTISGISDGEHLKVIWPGAGWDQSGAREFRADILPLMAILHPEEMVTALLREVERVANTPTPVAERMKHIARLEHEIEELSYLEESLVCAAIASGETIERRSAAPPAAVLQLRVARARKSRAA
jgi:hypothetical protein